MRTHSCWQSPGLRATTPQRALSPRQQHMVDYCSVFAWRAHTTQASYEQDESVVLFLGGIVAPRRSHRVPCKAPTKKTDEGLPVHSFSGVMANLATITDNRIDPTLPGAEPFHKLTIPSAFQRKAFELLGIKIGCGQYG
jgi:hypothetical protein